MVYTLPLAWVIVWMEFSLQISGRKPRGRSEEINVAYLQGTKKITVKMADSVAPRAWGHSDSSYHQSSSLI